MGVTGHAASLAGRPVGIPRGVTATSAKAHRLRRYVDAFVANDLLTSASAISFQILSALVPFLLFGCALLGFLHLEGVWSQDLAPQLQESISKPAFAFVDDTVRKALVTRQVFWITAGFLLALWQVSGAVRAVMGALNRVHEIPAQRSWTRRMLVSIALARAVGACWRGAIGVVVGGPLAYGDVGGALAVLLFLARWGLAGALLLIAVAVLLHWAPERDQPLEWVTFGSVLIMAGWLAMSFGFGIYLRYVADYNSIFGGLATIVVLMAYLYMSAVVFLGGVQVDALARGA